MTDLGDVGYRVLRNPKGRLWVGKLRCVRVSPKGHSVWFESINCKDQFRVNYCPPPTAVEALEQYQRWQVTGGWPWGDDNRDEKIANIVEAEILKRLYWHIENTPPS